MKFIENDEKNKQTFTFEGQCKWYLKRLIIISLNIVKTFAELLLFF